MEIPIYRSRHWEYIIISDIKDASTKRQLSEWVFGRLQPLIQGTKGAILDCVFLTDYNEYLETHKLTLDKT